MPAPYPSQRQTLARQEVVVLTVVQKISVCDWHRLSIVFSTAKTDYINETDPSAVGLVHNWANPPVTGVCRGLKYGLIFFIRHSCSSSNSRLQVLEESDASQHQQHE